MYNRQNTLKGSILLHRLQSMHVTIYIHHTGAVLVLHYISEEGGGVGHAWLVAPLKIEHGSFLGVLYSHPATCTSKRSLLAQREKV